jgi:hypothetical protein
MRSLSLCLSAIVFTACGVPAGADPEDAVGAGNAIINGTQDGSRHPSTAALVGYRPASGTVVARCTGVLIAPTVVLTAAHCGAMTTDGNVAVTFEPKFVLGTSVTYVGKFIAHPAFREAESDPYDLAVVVFDAAIPNVRPAQLPEENSLSNLPLGLKLTAVGYGIQELLPGGERVQDQARWFSVSSLNATNAAWLRLSQNSATGNGGTCFGDSGGPNFLGAAATETNIVASTTITGDSNCRATSVTYRLDTATAREFLGQFVALP